VLLCAAGFLVNKVYALRRLLIWLSAWHVDRYNYRFRDTMFEINSTVTSAAATASVCISPPVKCTPRSASSVRIPASSLCISPPCEPSRSRAIVPIAPSSVPRSNGPALSGKSPARYSEYRRRSRPRWNYCGPYRAIGALLYAGGYRRL